MEESRFLRRAVFRERSPRGLLVGAAGFEPTTTRTPSECATGLRYAPFLSPLPWYRFVLGLIVQNL
jgi:hypothetical protein